MEKEQFTTTLFILLLCATLTSCSWNRWGNRWARSSPISGQGSGKGKGYGKGSRGCGWLNRVNCSEPTGITDGTVDYSGTGFEDIASYSCNTGFVLVGLSNRTCLSDESWSGDIPICVFAGCGSLPAPTRGDIIYTGQQQGDNATITCDIGYTLTGTGFWTCLVTGWSGSDGDCDPIPCQALQNPADGSVVAPTSPVFEDEAVYSCNSGFTLSGQERRCCLSTGLWSGTAPTCVFAGCGYESLSAPANGHIAYDGQQIGNTANVVCDTGYILNGAGSWTCLVTGWSGAGGQCDPVTCPSLTDPADGSVSTPNGIQFEAQAIYTCEPTFELNGGNSRCCLSTGSWSGTAPTCVPKVLCPALTAPTDGTVDVSGQQPLGSTATYTCTYGLVDGDLVRYCLGTDVGEWTGTEPTCASGIVKDCDDVYDLQSTTSGIYTVYPCGDTSCPVQLYCQMTADGGWMVFQRRVDNTVDFYRNWDEYKAGFGDPSANFWLGLDDLFDIISAGSGYELRVELEDFDGNTAFAEYSSFSIGPESDKYRLTVSGYKSSSTAGDSLTTTTSQNHNNQQFSTPDSDNDNRSGENCAVRHQGPWWHNNCHRSNLNGRYLGGPFTGSYADGIIWYTWKGYAYSLKTSVMMIRETGV